MSAICILPSARAQATLLRMAYELAEHNYGAAGFGASGIALRGVSVRGQHLSRRLAQLLGPEGVGLPTGHVAVLAPTDAVPAELPLVLVDDVLYSGQTLLSTLAEITRQAHRLPSIQVAVLIDRGHRRYPVSADVVGLTLATTLQQYVRVEVDAEAQVVEGWLE